MPSQRTHVRTRAVVDLGEPAPVLLRNQTMYLALTCIMQYIIATPMAIDDNWTTQLRKGVLELCILNIVGNDRVYGYDIVRQLRGLDGLVISEGTIYPILSRLKRDGLVRTSLEESPTGPARKYYELTRRGEQLRDDMNAYWDGLAKGISDLMRRSS